MIKRAVKDTIKSLPRLKPVFQERDRLRALLAEASATRERMDATLTSLELEKSSLASERDALRAERDALKAQAESQQKTWVPPGHFFSPIPAPEDIKEKEHEIWRRPLPLREIPGVELREEPQMKLFYQFADYYREQPFTAEKQEGLRYFFDNGNYSYSDAIFYHCMLRHLRPRRLVEVGSGYSSCVALDTSDLFLGGDLKCTFIEPYPKLLLSLIKEKDIDRIDIIAEKVQDVDLALFTELGEGDVLFIDSTHVSKTLSDVNHLFFNVLPMLKSGVFVHLHDIFYPFVYPKDWEYEGRAWNEAYVLRAFLQYNSAFEIYLYNSFIQYFHDAEFKQEMPLCMENTGGSIWLRKL